ncbi:STAS domain-containing protein [candidate division KSB1 bacterium]|nr:STAS domain-containing protein [candidate division KSB1 bacterium]
MEGIHLSVEKAGLQESISVIKVGGYIDTTTSSELEQALNNLIKAGSYLIIIDLGNVDYVSSAGWGIFISEIKGIREKGGDLKLVNMVPEVYEVFELLEFHHILKAYDSIEQAIDDFENRGMTKYSEPKKEIKPPKPKEPLKKEPVVEEEFPKISQAAILSIDEKIQKIIAANPDASTIQIVKLLNSKEYGYVKVGWFGLRRALKRLNLDSKKKRKLHSITYDG